MIINSNITSPAALASSNLSNEFVNQNVFGTKIRTNIIFRISWYFTIRLIVKIRPVLALLQKAFPWIYYGGGEGRY